MSLQASRSGIGTPEAFEIEAWRRQFDAVHCVRIPGFLDDGLLGWLRRRLAGAPFVERVHRDVEPPAVDSALADQGLLVILATLLNDQRLFDTVREVTGCDPIGRFHSVVYRLDPRPEHHDAWHGDNDGNRLVAMSINLSGPYDGGVLQLREGPSGPVLHEAANTVAGDAILFRIRPGLEHRVTAVTGTRPRLVAAGWFQRGPAFLQVLKDAFAR